MAVSQYLRPGSLLDAVRSQLTPDVIRSASATVGESEPATRQALNGAVPSVLSGLGNMATTSEGASNLAALVRQGGYAGAAENVGLRLSGGGATGSMLNAGQQLLGKIFGNKSSAVADLLAKSSGVSSSSATKLLSLAAPLTLGVLGKRATAQGLDASGIARALRDEKPDIAAGAPSGLSQLLGGGAAAVSMPAGAGADRLAEPVHLERVQATEVLAEREGARPMRWLPLALAALAALVLLLFLRSRTVRPNVGTMVSGAASTANAPARVELPGGTAISVPKGTINYNLTVFLADKSATDVPKTFVFDHLNFYSGSTRVTPDSVPTITDLASVLKAYPNAQVQLVGHTDNTGSAETNHALSLDRANAVKGLLVNHGVAADRITTTGYGQDRPVASNDTEDGRARNRRLELNVTAK